MTGPQTEQTDPTKTPAAEADVDNEALFAQAVKDLSADDPASPPAAGRDQAGDDGGDQGATDDPPAQAAGTKGDRAPQNDIWANVPAEVKAAYEKERSERQALEHRLRSDEGRVRTYQKQIEELKAAGASAPAPKVDLRERLKAPELATLREEYPEIAAPFLSLLEEVAGTISEQNSKLSALDQGRRQQEVSEQEAALLAKMPDYQDMLAKHDAAFAEWLPKQPRHIREAIERNFEAIVDAEEAADVLGRFRASLGQGNERPGNEPAAKAAPSPALSDRRQRQLDSAIAPRSRGPSVATGIPENGDPEAMFKMIAKQLGA